ncbi:hypothetical protein [Algibacter pacificus]|uniref:hypothetical protein n=1 Tax=Algibacter pacificus TaxID=2599389 RepID=UPI0011C93D6B|nr:hypothetical protein [Algibacter pacificus]
MTIHNKKISTLILLFIVGLVCNAQGGMPPAPVPPPKPVGLPIDGGVLVAAFFALVYGVKKSLKTN